MERFKSAKRYSVIGILGNLFLLIIKGILGFITKSQAMIADAFNSAGDCLSSIMTLIGNKIASTPSDEDHNLGHGKAEYIYSMLVSIVMILTGLLVFKDSFLSLIYKTKYRLNYFLIIVCIITIIVKLALYIYTNSMSKKNNNLLIKANAKDHRNDVLITSLNLFSVILAYNNIYFVDGIVGIIISMFILKSSIEIFIESYNVLMDKSISDETKNKVYEIIKEFEEIKKINHFNSTPVGYRYQISVTIFVDGNMSTYESHKIADNLEKRIVEEIDDIYLAVIHVNPL